MGGVSEAPAASDRHRQQTFAFDLAIDRSTACDRRGRSSGRTASPVSRGGRRVAPGSRLGGRPPGPARSAKHGGHRYLTTTTGRRPTSSPNSSGKRSPLGVLDTGGGRRGHRRPCSTSIRAAAGPPHGGQFRPRRCRVRRRAAPPIGERWALGGARAKAPVSLRWFPRHLCPYMGPLNPRGG